MAQTKKPIWSQMELTQDKILAHKENLHATEQNYMPQGISTQHKPISDSAEQN